MAPAPPSWARSGTNSRATRTTTSRCSRISTDPVFALKGWAEAQQYTFPLLSDFWPHGATARAYGVFNEAAGMANRGTFVVDRDGVVRFAELNQPGEPRDQSNWVRALDQLTA